MKRRRGHARTAAPTAEPATAVDDWEAMLALARASAATGYPWDFSVVLGSYFFVRLFGFIRDTPRRVAAGMSGGSDQPGASPATADGLRPGAPSSPAS
jgi:hypothetical protein